MIKPELLVAKLQAKTAVLGEFAEQQWIFDARGALLWPKHKLMVVSDLHFEKGSFFAQQGSLLPQYDSLCNLDSLTALITDYQPHTIIALGDSFHDQNAWHRLPQHAAKKLTTLVESVQRWIWVLGNHDPELPNELPGEQTLRVVLDDIVFVHEPEDVEEKQVQVYGHFHPKMNKRVARQQMTGRCFMHDAKQLVMPSFGAYTGGLNIEDDAFLPLLKHKMARKHLLYQSKIFTF